MVGSAMLAIALSSTAMETAMASVAMARRRGAGRQAVRQVHQAPFNAATANLTAERPANKLSHPTEFRSCDAPAANRGVGPAPNGSTPTPIGEPAYYVVLFDQATDAIYDAIGVWPGVSGLRPGTPPSPPRRRGAVRARGGLGERVRITSHLLGVDVAKRLHYFHEMFHAEAGHRVAAQELMALHIDLRVRRTTAFAPALLARIEAVVRARAGEPIPEGVGRRIAMPAAHGT